MELTTEITKVFGEEMAKIFSNSLSEEELQKTAKESWKKINEHTWRYGEQQDSELDSALKREIFKKIFGFVNEELKTNPITMDESKEIARRVIANAKIAAEKTLTDHVAMQMIKTTMYYSSDLEEKFMQSLNALRLHERDQHGIF